MGACPSCSPTYVSCISYKVRMSDEPPRFHVDDVFVFLGLSDEPSCMSTFLPTVAFSVQDLCFQCLAAASGSCLCTTSCSNASSSSFDVTIPVPFCVMFHFPATSSCTSPYVHISAVTQHTKVSIYYHKSLTSHL